MGKDLLCKGTELRSGSFEGPLRRKIEDTGDIITCQKTKSLDCMTMRFWTVSYRPRGVIGVLNSKVFFFLSAVCLRKVTMTSTLTKAARSPGLLKSMKMISSFIEKKDREMYGTFFYFFLSEKLL